jgi:hypothetical protein
MWRFLCLVGLMAIAACGAQPAATPILGGGMINSGVVPVTQAGAYRYTVTCPNGVTIPCCRTDPPGPGAYSFRLTSDSGTSDYLNASGMLYLTPGNWSGHEVESIFVQPGNLASTPPGPSLAPVTCAWALTLTPS